MTLPNTRRGSKQNTRTVNLPAPVGGINAMSAAANMSPTESVWAFNLIAEDFGLEVRDGYIEWANGWTGSFARTVVTFEGNIKTDDKLWVANDEGIWDVTIEGTTAPVQVVTFPSSLNDAGVCSYINYGNDNGDRFLLLCDGENGYYVWTQTTNTWDKIAEGGGAGNITGADPALFNFVMIWKTRVWFIQKDSGIAYFIEKSKGFTGPVERFNWADQFRTGGELVGLYNWTLDGGNGVDDYLVGLSRSGDVVIYQGIDPTSKDDFGLVGSWHIGELPAGNRVATEYSGELYILCAQGVIPLSNLIRGSGGSNPESYITYKISSYIRLALELTRGEFGWHIHVHPNQALLFINAPTAIENVHQNGFVMYFGSQAWSLVTNLPKAHSENWHGSVYWVDDDSNRIFIQGGFEDAVYLDPETDGPPLPIEWSMLSAYSDLGMPAMFKRCQFITPMFQHKPFPQTTVEAWYDYDLTYIPPSGALPPADPDQRQDVRGGNGMGKAVAVYMKGKSTKQTILSAFSIMHDSGGML